MSFALILMNKVHKTLQSHGDSWLEDSAKERMQWAVWGIYSPGCLDTTEAYMVHKNYFIFHYNNSMIIV